MYFDEEHKSLEDKKKEITRRIGSRARRIRKQKNKTLQDFGQAYNMSVSTLSDYEKGKTLFPATILPIIADDYNTDMEYFFRLEDQPVYKDNVIKYCTSKLVEGKEFESALYYMQHLQDKATNNVGAARLFDLMYIMFRLCGEGQVDYSMIIEQFDIILSEDDRRSRYINYATQYGEMMMKQKNERKQ